MSSLRVISSTRSTVAQNHAASSEPPTDGGFAAALGSAGGPSAPKGGDAPSAGDDSDGNRGAERGRKHGERVPGHRGDMAVVAGAVGSVALALGSPDLGGTAQTASPAGAPGGSDPGNAAAVAASAVTADSTPIPAGVVAPAGAAVPGIAPPGSVDLVSTAGKPVSVSAVPGATAPETLSPPNAVAATATTVSTTGSTTLAQAEADALAAQPTLSIPAAAEPWQMPGSRPPASAQRPGAGSAIAVLPPIDGNPAPAGDLPTTPPATSAPVPSVSPTGSLQPTQLTSTLFASSPPAAASATTDPIADSATPRANAAADARIADGAGALNSAPLAAPAPSVESNAAAATALPATIAGQVSDQLVRLVSVGAGEMVMRLHPPELGDLTVRIAVNGRDVSAWFESAQPLVQLAISDGIGQLHADLGSAGYNLSGAWVGGDTANAGQQGNAPPTPPARAAVAEAPGFGPASGVPSSRPAPGVSIYV